MSSEKSQTPDTTGLRRLVAAADDMLSGWRYIRARHGDLDGVGWDRAENAVIDALAAVRVDALEAVLAAAAHLRHDQDCPCIFDIEICTCHMKSYHAALAALDATQPETTTRKEAP